MPTYEYRCSDGHEFELFQRMSDDPVAECPRCGEPAERLLSAGAGFLFKGEGFYITDYRSEEYRKKAKAESNGGKEARPASDPPGSGEGGAAGGESGSDGKGAADGPAKQAAKEAAKPSPPPSSSSSE